MKLQILDCDYILIHNRPVVRIFGKDSVGNTVCVFKEGFLPYMYLHVKDRDINDVVYEIEKLGLRAEVTDKFLPIGYKKTPEKVVKITGRDPSKIPEIRESLKRFGVPYEADILFKYRFMSDNNIKGMNWIEVEGTPVRTNTVKCRAIDAKKIKPLDLFNNAPLKYMSVDIECLPTADRIAEPEKDPIIMVSFAFSPSFRNSKNLVLVSRPVKKQEGVMSFGSEKEMMERFLRIMKDYDPDIVIGYNINNFDLPYITKRLEVLNLPRDFGRSEKNVYCRKLQQTYMPYMSGRVVVDPYEIIRRDPWVRFKRYNLDTVAKEMLGIQKIPMGYKEMVALWSANKLDRVIEYSRRDAVLALKLVIDKGLLDQFFELAKISGLLLQDSLSGQTQRHENKLLNEFRDRNIIMPCKPGGTEMAKRISEREKSGLKGALVLEPEVGLHTDGCTIVLDFTSLYPSLIKAYNICPTTLLLEGEADHVVSPFGSRFVLPEIREGILPKIVDELMTTRSKVRKELKEEKDPEKKRILNAKQLALKTMANSLYGYTGYIRSRLYVMDIANTITSFGRETITNTKKIIEENFPFKVIYSDTDSVFIRTNITDLDEAKEIGEKISDFVSKRSGKLHLKYEKTFKTFLILAKKRYAGWSFEKDGDIWKDKIAMKGIETVRRDWCGLTTDTMNRVLDIILKEQDIGKASKYVRSVIHELNKGLTPLEKLTIIKGITKEISRYNGIQPHVELAKKISKRDPTRKNWVGERLGFVIIKGNQLLSKRAEDPDYIKEKGLEIDSSYYVQNQLMPPLERIFEACGLTTSELLEGSRQKSLQDMLRPKKKKSPEETILSGFDSIVCKNCNWSFRRPTLTGLCPKCHSKLYFSGNGSIGTTVQTK